VTVLVDTSVWRRFFSGKGGAKIKHALGALLDEDDALLIHTAVLGELVLGGLSPREEALLGRLPRAPQISDGEVLAFIRQRKLVRRGIGWVDAHLLASALVASAKLWSADARLGEVAADLEIAFSGSAT
jgi:predicted nucleic acid-binding protein